MSGHFLLPGTCSSTCLDFEEDYMAWENPGVGKFLLFMFLQGLLFMAVVLALEMSLVDKLFALFKVGAVWFSSTSLTLTVCHG